MTVTRRIACLLVCSTATLAYTARAAEPEGVEAVDAAWRKALLANDVDAIVACYADDAIFWAPNHAQLTGRDAIRGLFKGMLQDVTVTDVKMSDTVYKTVGDRSVGWGTFAVTLKPKDGGDVVTMTGRFTAVAEKRAGKWVYVVDHASADPEK